jgi:hypothetical protein
VQAVKLSHIEVVADGDSSIGRGHALPPIYVQVTEDEGLLLATLPTVVHDSVLFLVGAPFVAYDVNVLNYKRQRFLGCLIG